MKLAMRQIYLLYGQELKNGGRQLRLSEVVRIPTSGWQVKKMLYDLISLGRGRMQRQGAPNDPYNEMGGPYKKGYEVHPNESHTECTRK
ncbi:hypothetical protein EKF56_22650 [Salmonella enterica]|nr:hypothetical protein [Salmonella enterica]EAU1471537.1 hypothetical protein [Salmonella enterica]EBV2538085.1 hypothetical protein [Salmonella enterica subsp. enterica serovar Agbeni]EBX2927911.1 hypothetical protein [Salmonella enterica subsp. enterica serovar Agbeni]